VWIRALLMVHTSHLMALPELAGVIAGLYSIVDARVSVFPQLLKLSGRLDLVLSHVSAEWLGVM